MRVIGLTGSIGMGKTTTAGLFADQGVPVFDADEAVHDLYAGEAVDAVGAAFPGIVTDGAVDRVRLAAHITDNPGDLKRLEAIVHPLVRQKQGAFLNAAQDAGSSLALLDIPLLFETGRDGEVDVIIVVSADPAIQRARVLARPGMTPEKFEALLSRQMPDAEKRARAHFVVDTGHGIADAKRQVCDILQALSD